MATMKKLFAALAVVATITAIGMVTRFYRLNLHRPLPMRSVYEEVNGMDALRLSSAQHSRATSAANNSSSSSYTSDGVGGSSGPTAAGLTNSSLQKSTSQSQSSGPSSRPTDKPDKVICIHLTGRLGNQLFQYAAVLGLAFKLNRIPVFYDTGMLDNVLHLDPETSIAAGGRQYRQRCDQAKGLHEKKCCRLNGFFLTINPKVDVRVSQYMQSWKYFEGFEENVRQAMRFKEDVVKQAAEVLRDLRKTSNSTLVGVHVRRGDYLANKHVRLGYVTAPARFYLDAMSYMRKRFGNVTFFVSTDSAKWFKESVTSSPDVFLLKRRSAEVDMALLSSMDHTIISVGTYSWWVGFLNSGVTVYWKDFIAAGTYIGNNFDPDGSTFIYPGWIPM